MKSAASIINSIKDNKNFDKLSNIEQFATIKESLPKTLASNIEFLYIKNSILFFVFRHPAMKMEFEYKKDSIKMILEILKKNSRIDIDVTDIKAFVTNRVQEEEKIEIKPQLYTEQSSAEFENHIKDEKLHKIFEEIRESINAKR
jgi:precorrin isomerase